MQNSPESASELFLKIDRIEIDLLSQILKFYLFVANINIFPYKTNNCKYFSWKKLHPITFSSILTNLKVCLEHYKRGCAGLDTASPFKSKGFILPFGQLVVVFLHNDCGVVSAKAKGIAQRDIHSALLRLVEGEVQCIINVFILISVLMVDGGRHNVVLHGKD